MFKKNTTIKETRLLSGKDSKDIRRRVSEQFKSCLDGVCVCVLCVVPSSPECAPLAVHLR